MITIPANETKMYIEDALMAVGYAERMIRLADHTAGRETTPPPTESS